VPPHITLVPPVNVSVDKVESAVAVVRAAAGRAGGPLDLTIGPAATFAPVSPVVYLSVGGAGVERLETLHDDVLAGPLGRPPDWPFVPHVTIASEAPPERLRAAVAALGDFQAPVSFERVHVLQEGEDRAWRPLADVALGPPAVIGRGGLPVELAVSEGLDPETVRFLNASNSLAPPFAITARREGEVVGVAAGSTGGLSREARLDGIVVSTAVRRQGIGRHLLVAVEDLAIRRGCTRVVLIVQAGDPAEAFFAGRGWVVDRPLPRWSHGRDFVRLVRELQ
jgi:2'-5' RNA ligase